MKTLKLFFGLLFLTVIALCVMVSFACRQTDEEELLSPGSITTTHPMQEERAVHASTLLPDGRVLITGGFGKGEIFKRSAEIFDPATRTFTLTGEMHVPRAGHQAVLLKTGQVLVLGGTVGDTDPHSRTAELYDPSTGTFTLSGSMHTARMSCSATVLPDGKVLVAGGLDGNKPLTSMERYDPATGSFTPSDELEVIKGTHIALPLKNGQILFLGSDFAAERYDPADGKSQAVEINPPSQVKHKYAATLLPDEKVLLTGGSDARDWEGKFATAMVYDLKKGTCTPTDNMHLPRFKHGNAVVLLDNGNVLVAGGGAFAELYNPLSGEFDQIPGSFHKTLQFATATLLKDGQVLITGGYEMNIICSNESWLYRPRLYHP